jgi:hypothetical protein
MVGVFAVVVFAVVVRIVVMIRTVVDRFAGGGCRWSDGLGRVATVETQDEQSSKQDGKQFCQTHLICLAEIRGRMFRGMSVSMRGAWLSSRLIERILFFC